MINFLYCFDDNYNFQAFSSMISLLDKINSKVNIFIIHKSKNNKQFLPNKIINHKYLNNLMVYKFEKEINNYPNLYNAHVSEATYYRLFCHEYLPNLESVFYIDADIICVNDPLSVIIKNTEDLLGSNFIFSSKTELTKEDENKEVFDRLELNSSRYFNAGVMNINLIKWKKLTYNYLELFENVGHKLNYWDQDLLNYLFDGNYLELDSRLNKVIDFSLYEYIKKLPSIESITLNKNFIHFAGSHKPWSVNGIMVNLSEIYQKEFRKISQNYFHITHKIRSYSIYVFYKNVVNFKFFRIENKILFLKDFIKSLFKVKIKVR